MLFSARMTQFQRKNAAANMAGQVYAHDNARLLLLLLLTHFSQSERVCDKDNLTTIVKKALCGPRNTQGIECSYVAG